MPSAESSIEQSGERFGVPFLFSLAAQGLSVTDAAVAGAYIHGLAGEIAEKKFTRYSATIDRITECIPKALSKIISGK